MSVAGVVGRGLAAGVVGTVALTIAEKAEIKLTGREPSMIPGQVGAALSGHDPQVDVALVRRLNPVVHWAHGITMGAVRASLDAAGMTPKAASAVFFPILWGSDAALYATLRVAPPPWEWSLQELGTDLYGKGVLAFAISGAYVALGRLS